MDNKRILQSIVIFLLGAGAGALVVSASMRSRGPMAGAGAPPLKNIYSKRLEQSLSMNAQQKAAFDAALERTGERLFELRRRSLPETLEIMAKGIEELKKDMTPEQAKVLEQTRARLAARAQKLRGEAAASPGK